MNWAFEAWPVIIPISRLVRKTLHIRGVKLEVFLNYILVDEKKTTTKTNLIACLASTTRLVNVSKRKRCPFFTFEWH